MLCEDEKNKDVLHIFGSETLDFVVVFLCTANCIAKQMEHYEILYMFFPMQERLGFILSIVKVKICCGRGCFRITNPAAKG